MNEPICFAQYFANKQNVRSLSNILNSKLLKSENETVFLQEVLKEEILIREISPELKKMLLDVQQNIKYCSKQDFKNYFVNLDDEQQKLLPVNKEKIYEDCSIALSKIIPKKLFGNNHNTKIFKKCTKIIIYSMKRQHLNFGKLIQKWDFKIFPWTNITQSSQVLYNILHWIFKVVLAAVISLNFYVTTSKINNDENLLHFFWKNKWQSFYDRKVSEMVTAKVINKYHANCLGKKVRKKYSLQEKLKLKTLKKEIPKLHLVLKPNNNYRPIVRYKTESLNATDKYKIKERLYFLRKLTGKPHEKIEVQFTKLYFKWLEKNKPKLYFVKTDLSNAFGSINKAKLLKILCERHQELQKTETSMYMKKKLAQHYKEFIAELRKPLLIRAGSTAYEWKEGLMQGYKFSPALSELYYSYLDDIYFSEHLKNGHELKLFIRVVDDYLYVTDSLEDAHLYLKALSNYRNVNYTKTVVNFEHDDINCSPEITFLGYSYNTENLEVSRSNTVFTGQLCYKIAFSAATENIGKFLENRIGQSGIQINGHLFNFHYNNEELIWQHIFLTLCLSANKFCTILSLLCDANEMPNYLSVYKKKVSVKLCNTITETLKKNGPKDFQFVYCVNHFRYLSFKALLLCATKTSKCNVLVPYVNVELAKSNCINGKWKEHARVFSKSGKNLAQAIKEVCRRTDLRQIFKKFDILPCDFQCFDHRQFYQL
ncbi:telomerase reverse transcriptase-like [Maniola hyperantus]|uniref:telomerase reverse transcriptase-like n=1 Tax=Aphantopus hyperantus TaxID=2795564 RepID=UPI00156A2F31|nr:telomerase reverse transcriptase-like [Maniola hyperantus]